MDEANKDGFETGPNDPLLKTFQQMADRIDRARFPGQAWPASAARSARRHRLLRFIVPAAAMAASILVGMMLYPDLASHGKRQIPPQFAALPTGPASTQATPLHPQPTFLDTAVLADVRLSAPDMNLAADPVALPSVGSRLGGPDSYTWDIPEIHLSSL